MKTIGANARPPKRIEFQFTFLRDGQTEVHQFAAICAMDAGTLAATMSGGDAGALTGMLEMMVRMLDNRDGTPVDWKAVPLTGSPEVIEQDPNAVAQAYEEPVRDSGIIRFEAPDGRLLPIDQAPQFLEFEQGSSRRRWKALLDSESIVIQAEALKELFEYLVSQVAERPTRR